MTQQPQYRFHISALDAWNAMLAACDCAKTSIRFEQYVLDPDNIGVTFIDMFIRKAQEGVEVTLLLDWLGCRPLKHSDHYRRLCDAGVCVRFFRPPAWQWLIRAPRFFPRDHRKILIIDECTTFVGGVCVYDNVTEWRDTMAELTGAVTKQFLHVFHQTWAKVNKDERDVEAHPDFDTNEHFTVYANAPDSDENLFTDALIDHIYKATDRIDLVTPYFTPGRTLRPALEAALARGVKLTILLSDESKYAPYVAGKALCGDLILKGACVYYYKPVMLHAKIMLIDNEWAAIGSCNLDGLSIHRNQEVMLASTDTDFIKELSGHMATDISNSARFTYTDWKRRPLSEKITGAAFLPFRYYL